MTEPGFVLAGIKEDLLVKSVAVVPSGPVAAGAFSGPLSIDTAVVTLITNTLSSPPVPVPVLSLPESTPCVAVSATPLKVLLGSAT